jgi:prophage antirepressor-like protein
MDILKCLELIDNNYKLNIEGTPEEPLYQANQVGIILDLRNIHDSLQDYDDTEKVLLTIQTNGGRQKMVYLTEKGLYRLIMRSKKPNANIFQKWISTHIKNLRINGEYKLSRDNEIDSKLLDIKIENEKHNTLIKSFDKQNVIYVCKLRNENDKILIKAVANLNYMLR